MAHAETTQVTTPSDREIAMTRSFRAPRELVFKAWTTPELLKRWLYGPEGHALEVCELDLRVGGSMRFVWRLPDGNAMGMRGTYREITPPERIVYTEIYDDDWTGGETLVTLELVEAAGRTTSTLTVLYSSREARDAALRTPMAEGVEMGYARLEALLAKPASRS